MADREVWQQAATSAVRAIGRDLGAIGKLVGRKLLDGAYRGWTRGGHRRPTRQRVRDEVALTALVVVAFGAVVAAAQLGWLVVGPTLGAGYVATSAARRAAARRAEPRPRAGGPVPVTTHYRNGARVTGHSRSTPS